MNIPVTLLYGGLTILLLTLLGLNVTRLRIQRRAGAGRPVPPELFRPSRAHGNAAEWVPAGVVLLLALELTGRIPSFWLHVLGGTLFLGRLVHAAGMLARWRVATVGATINYVVTASMAVLALGLGLGR